MDPSTPESQHKHLMNIQGGAPPSNQNGEMFAPLNSMNYSADN